MDRVLAAIDGSDNSNRSLDTLIKLAQELKSPPDVVLVSVTVPLPPVMGMEVMASPDLLAAYYEKAQQQTLAAARAKLQAAGLVFTERKELGEPAELIVQIASETGAKMIFMGSRGAGALANLLLGSTANKVLHLAKVPVVMTH